MTNRELAGWLEHVMLRAQEAGWCTRPYCTTCGGMEFRRAFWAAAARQTDVRDRFESESLPRELLEDLSATERDALVRALVAGLRELRAPWTNTEAFKTIIIDLDPPLIRHGVPMSLETSLSGTPAGAALHRMRARAEAVEERRDQRLAYASPQAIEERRRVKREERAVAQAQRQAEKQRKDMVRLSLLNTLSGLSPAERLSRFATDSGLTLDSVPADLIPAREIDLIDLERTQVLALIARIGRRRGVWGRLRRMLENRINDGTE